VSEAPIVTSKQHEIIALAWKIFNQEHPDLAEKICAQVSASGEEPDIDQIVMLSWKTGFYSAMLAYEVGAIKDLSGPINPAHN
jgi:hypothetical protein